jgi:hypothetical protein
MVISIPPGLPADQAHQALGLALRAISQSVRAGIRGRFLRPTNYERVTCVAGWLKFRASYATAGRHAKIDWKMLSKRAALILGARSPPPRPRKTSLPARRTARTAASPARQREPTSFMCSSRLAQLSADHGTVQHLDVTDIEGYSDEECRACNKFPVSGAPM